MNIKIALSCLLSLNLLSLACGKKKAETADLNVSLQLAVDGTATSGTPLIGQESAFNTTNPDALSFTPELFKVPVKRISFGPSTIYECNDSDEACYLDMANKGELQSAASRSSKTIEAGTYQTGVFSLCRPTEPTQDHIILVKGKASVKGVTYYTTNTDEVLTTDPSKYSVASYKLSTCQLNLQLSKALVVEKDQKINLTLFSLVQGIAYMQVGASVTNNDKFQCKMNAANDLGVCVNYPVMVPYAGTGQGLLETYQIYSASEDVSKASGLLHLVLNEAGDLFGGTTFIYKNSDTPTLTTISGFGQALKKSTVNADGTLALETHGSKPETESCGYIVFSAFKRATKVGETSSGTLKKCLDGILANAESFDYVAKRIKSENLSGTVSLVENAE